MADEERSRRGLNPNAQAFVPNPEARPFIPGQPYIFAAPQPAFSHPPPATAQPFPMYQQYVHMAPSAVAAAWDDDVEEDESVEQNEALRGLSQGDVEHAAIKEEAKIMDLKSSEVAAMNVTAKGVGGEKFKNTASKLEAEEEERVAVATLPAKFKQAAVIDDSSRKEHVNMVFIGHVDAGKSTIGGHLMYLTGMVDKRTLEKYEREAKDKGRESWLFALFIDCCEYSSGISAFELFSKILSFLRYLSWALDTNDEEREKGKTVECGRAFFETEKKHFTILDAPGHKSFVPNMISGATQADLAVLVISARKGEFETGFDRGGQTREHAMLVKTAGVKYLVVLVNKMDDPTVCWDQGRYKEIQSKLTPYLRKCGFSPKTDITYIPVSGLTGAFLKERPGAEFGSWYTGPCFIEYIDTMLPSISRDYEGPVRVIIADKYSDMGTIIIGKVQSGIVVKGQTLTVMPNRSSVQVIQLWSDDVETDKIVSGDNVKLKLKGIEDADILPGFVLCSPDALCHVGRVFDAEVVILDHKSIIASGYSCVLHIQSATEEVVVRTVICTIDKKTGNKVRARFVKQDEKCIMRLESSETFCLEAFKDFPQMGRFTLRDEGKTIAIGKVLKVVE
ncbi:unnamed protein product [Gongylonema pulchrum]|uniref:Tr-type G domain-containing protein n=1 Tax=Gongylonema pulchrum TaxID=637853 RepID=A0A183DXV7_9BILA|nr:unnamed protein product [Gongylonema pulchrum]